MTRTLNNTLLASGAALLLSAGAAAAAPAMARSDLNVRSGPGTEYQVIGSLQDGETVDVASCTGSWCQISFSGGTGYASQNYLTIGDDVGPSAGVAVVPGYTAAEPGYAYDDYPDYSYGPDYYDYGYTYGPSFGFSIGPGFRHHRHGWHGRPGGSGHAGNWHGRPGGWQGRPGNQIGNATPGANRPGGGPAPGVSRPQMSAPTGMRVGGNVGGGFRGGAAAGGARVGIGGGGAPRVGGGPGRPR